MSKYATSTPKSVTSHGSQISPFRKQKGKEKDTFKTKTAGQSVARVPLIYEGVNVTPIALNPFVYEGTKERQINIIETLAVKDTSFLQNQSLTRTESQRFQNNLLLQKQEVETAFTGRSTVTSAYFGDDIILPALAGRTDYDSTDLMGTESYEEFVLEPKIPEHISLILTETETMLLLEMPSCTISKTSEEAEAVDEDNKLYDFLTKGKGRNRKVFHVGVQTLEVLKKTRDTETKRMKYQNMSTYVSAWEMHDTYKNTETRSVDGDSDVFEVNEELLEFGLNDHKLNEESSLESFRISTEEKQLLKIVKSKDFQDALTVIERILGSNCYNEQQKRYKGLSDPDVFRENIQYKYRLELLWTYSNDDTLGRCVTQIALNSFNEDMIAVSYGKFYYKESNTAGMVLIWNIKNPQQPERQYKFLCPVTTLAFSKTTPNLLAVGFYNGHLKILDVSRREVWVIREDSTFFDPIWSITWFQQGDEESLMVGFGNGRVYKYQITAAAAFKRTQIMVTAAAEGKLKGINYMKKCESQNISITGYDQVRCLALHPTDPFTYFVGSSEGVVHRCSTNYYNEHTDLFKAHDAAIHTLKFSPFANKLYATCGDDFLSHLWIDGISEPLSTSPPASRSVLDLDWSPQHPTVLATISGSDVLIWDFQRKLYAHQSLEKTPSPAPNTICRFTINGRCLIVGNMDGFVYVYSLEDMPMPAFFPENIIMQSLKKILITKPELLRKLQKLGSLNFDKQDSSKYFN